MSALTPEQIKAYNRKRTILGVCLTAFILAMVYICLPILIPLGAILIAAAISYPPVWLLVIAVGIFIATCVYVIYDGFFR